METVWKLEGITKEFPGVIANNNVSLALKAGEIHGLLGENGCGKSTLVSILSGVAQPTSGVIFGPKGKVTFHGPKDARRAGIATVFQEFSLIPNLTVAENIFLGRRLPKNIFGLIDQACLRQNAREVLATLSLEEHLQVDAKISSLSVAKQQLVEIAKAVAIGGRTLILDEPTAALSAAEIHTLHDLLYRLRDDGVAILYVSHRLEEVVELVDCATILKDGKVVSIASETPIEVRALVRLMIGTDPGSFFRHESKVRNKVVMEVSNLAAQGVEEASFELREGEVLGIAGLMGSGRTELLSAIFGLSDITGGQLSVFGETYVPSSPRNAISRGIGFVPENRKTDALFFNLNGPQNVSVAALDSISLQGWWINDARELSEFEKVRSKFGLPPRAHLVSPRALSGGNQQKIVLGRWLMANSHIILMDEPTQGVDVGAKGAIYDLVRDLTLSGRSLILVSSDIDELMALSDRIALLRAGKLLESFETAQLNEQELAELIAATSRKEISNKKSEVV